ncbi:MAG: hypothetical protein NDI84_17650 [Steroidobacteraceae bacterium]|nr:hypothetical protein [Steroidobacteraceae bacterium]
MQARIAGFEWDTGNRSKCTRHGVTIAEIESVFGGEVHFLGIGRTALGRYVFTAFTLRQRGGETWLRIISARFMHAREIRHFQKEAARSPD